MKKLFIIIVVLFILYFGILFLKSFLRSEDEFDYMINDFLINETSFFYSDREDLYVFKIEADKTFNFQVSYNYNKDIEIIKDIKYFKNDNYECLLPIYTNNVILSDMMCFEGDLFTYYYNVSGKDKELDDFASTYDFKHFNDTSNVTEIEGIDVYKDNLVDNHFLEFTNYKGIYNVSKEFNSVVYDVSLYDIDIYNQKVSFFVDNYFLSADYNEVYTFNEFNLFDFKNLKQEVIVSNYSISFDSYIQGVVDGEVYLFDKDSKVQYVINIEDKTVKLAGTMVKYYNKEWQTMTINQALEELMFTYEEDYEIVNYDYVKKINDFYYLFKKVNDGYEVYKSYNDSIIYLFSLNDIKNLLFIDNYVYYVEDSFIKYYNEKTGIKKVIKYDELNFNENIEFYVYEGD